jgi:hypothetical protein
MTQLYCYVPDSIAQQVQRRAAQAGISLSRYLAELVKRDIAATGWPEGYFDIFALGDGSLMERPPQVLAETRLNWA